MDDVRTRIVGTLAVVGLLVALGGCAYGAHEEHARAQGADQGEPQPIPAQHAAAGQDEPRFEPVSPEPAPASEPEPADQFAYADQGGQAGERQKAGQAAQHSWQQGGEGAAQATADGETYTVRDGDTLWSIADSVYGDGQKWREILDANPGLRPEELHVGQELSLP